jgi:hypothetical protein
MSDRRRKYHREYAARSRAEALAVRQGNAGRCVRRFGKWGVCGARLDVEINRLGQTIASCPACDRVARGICRDCPAPVAGQLGYARRCAAHQKLERLAASRRWSKAHPDRVRAKNRARSLDPERHARTLEYKRAWRKANPAKVRQQKRRAGLRQPKRVATYMARYRKRHREYYRQMGQRLYREHHPRKNPTCVTCGAAVIWNGRGRPTTACDRCCWPYQLRERLARRALEAAMREVQAPAPKARRLVSPSHPAKRLPTGERLCCVPHCTTVVHGRRKKCEACWTKDASIAAHALEGRRGRGRRTDLDRVARPGRAA